MEIKNHDEYWQAANRLEELRQVPYVKHAAAREALHKEYWELEKTVRQYLTDNPKKAEPTFTLEDMRKAFKAGKDYYDFDKWLKDHYPPLEQ